MTIPKPIAYTPTESDLVGPQIYQMPIKGLYYMSYLPHEDERGFYAEIARLPDFEEAMGSSFEVKQLNLSYSEKNVIRGLHAENWNKLLSVLSGTCFCAWVDLRADSETFGQTVTMEVGRGKNSNFGTVFVSRGIANSFCVTRAPLRYLYAVDQLYAERDTSGDIAINLFDPDLAIDWPLDKEKVIVSQRDQKAVSLKEKFPDQFK